MKNRFELHTIIGLALVVIAVLILVSVNLPSGPPPKNSADSKTISARSKDAQDAVNKHLEMTAAEIDLQRRKAEIEAQKLRLQKGEASQGYQNAHEGVELNKEDSEKLARDLNLDRKVPSNSPMDMIQQQILAEQQAQQMDEEAKKEYARQFVENARRGGYDVQLDEEFRVISVKRIKSR